MGISISKATSILLMLFMFFSCSPERQEQNEEIIDEIPADERTEKAMLDEVIEIHDEVMPKIEDIMRLQGRLQARFDSLMFEEANPEELTELREKIKNLRSADSAMMTWMRQFKPVADSINHESRMEYLAAEREKISQVRDMINNSIKEAEESIEKR